MAHPKPGPLGRNLAAMHGDPPHMQGLHGGGPQNPLNTVFSNVPSLNGLGRPSIMSGINGERPMTSFFPDHSSCWVKPSLREKMTLLGFKGTM
jgi:hypothetical protein